MADNLLFIVQSAAGELGLPVPTTVVSNPDAQTRQMLAHVNRVGRNLVKAHEWSALTDEPYVFQTVANQEFYPFPADFDRVIGNTQWDRSMHWQLLGPDDPQIARWRRESNISTASPRLISRQEGANLSIYPIDVEGGHTIVYDYVSRNWAVVGVNSASPPTIPAATIGVADTDITVFNSDLMIAGLKYRFMMAKGMASSQALQLEYIDWLKRSIAADLGGGQILNMSPQPNYYGNADYVVPGVVVLNIPGDFNADFGPDFG